jgi:hypothetical protein
MYNIKKWELLGWCVCLVHFYFFVYFCRLLVLLDREGRPHQGQMSKFVVQVCLNSIPLRWKLEKLLGSKTRQTKNWVTLKETTEGNYFHMQQHIFLNSHSFFRAPLKSKQKTKFYTAVS